MRYNMKTEIVYVMTILDIYIIEHKFILYFILNLHFVRSILFDFRQSNL
jgi:hypothetical protein